MRSTPPATTTVATPSTPVTATPSNLREALAKSIKKDPEAYPVFKEARLWDSWNRKLKSMAHLHDLVNVLDENYRPTTKVEAELFELQKHFIYAVFLCKVTTTEAVNIIKEEKDAQLCYQALVHCFERFAESNNGCADYT